MKRWLFVLTVLLLFGLLTSCNANPTKSADTSRTESERSRVISSPVPSDPDEDETSVSKAVHEDQTFKSDTHHKIERLLPLSGINVDADFYENLTAESNVYRVTAEFQKPSLETAFRLFFSDKSIMDEQIYTDMGSDFYIYEADDGAVLTADDNTLYFDSSRYRYIGTVFVGGVSDPTYNADQYMSMKNLGFATIEEAHKEIQKIFDAMNIQTSELYTVYTLDSETVKKQKSILEEFDEMQQAYTQEEWQFQRMEWDDSLDCYYFEFYQEINGVMVTPFFHGSFEDGSLTQGAGMRVIYSKNGIEAFHFEFHYSPLEQQEIGPVLTMEDALGLLDQKYANLILEGDYTVSRILFEYVPVKIKNEENRFTLLPAWSFELDHTFTAEKGPSAVLAGRKEMVVFLATTGEEIISDMER